MAAGRISPAAPNSIITTEALEQIDEEIMCPVCFRNKAGGRAAHVQGQTDTRERKRNRLGGSSRWESEG